MPIVFEQVNHCYLAESKQAYQAITDISLTIQEGEFVGIIGQTGSGKSTLVQHLNGLLLPTSGTVTIDGLNTKDSKLLKQIRSKVGMVFQYPEYQLFEETVEKDISFGPKNMGLDTDSITERVNEALSLVGLDPAVFKDKSPFDLSGGEKRRVALAGIIAMEPKYLALDEPMAGLDPRGRREIMELLNNLRLKTGCAILMVSHSMDDIARYADRLLVIHKGRLVKEGAPQEVYSCIEELRSYNLSVPQATELSELLKSKGLPLPDGIITMRSLCDALVQEVQHGN